MAYQSCLGILGVLCVGSAPLHRIRNRSRFPHGRVIPGTPGYRRVDPISECVHKAPLQSCKYRRLPAHDSNPHAKAVRLHDDGRSRLFASVRAGVCKNLQAVPKQASATGLERPEHETADPDFPGLAAMCAVVDACLSRRTPRESRQVRTPPSTASRCTRAAQAALDYIFSADDEARVRAAGSPR